MAETKITVLVSEDLRRKAKASAALRGQSLSEAVRSFLERYVKETAQLEHDPKKALRTDPLLLLRFSGGPGNVADRAEEILSKAADRTTGFNPRQ